MSESQRPTPELPPESISLTTEIQVERATSEAALVVASEAEQTPVSAPESDRTPATTSPAATRTIPFIALPISTSQLLKKYGSSHPGLLSGTHACLLNMNGRQLDFQLKPENMQKIWQKTSHTLNQNPEVKAEWEYQSKKRQHYLNQLQARQFELQTLAPLRLESHQILGQTGLDLHPLYGFPYLPSARLKGLLRQYAESIWLPAQEDPSQARQRIKSLLGSPAAQGCQNGSLIIHDAWPENWPGVYTDLNACHHRLYYQRREAPGDWQTPEVRYFLSLRPGTRFSFAISSSQPGSQEELLLAEQWLKESLASLGYGSGGASGYGLMKVSEQEAKQSTGAHFSTQLQLTTPGFYRGSSQRSEDCQLRPTSLRGLLRWWWRTLHSGFLPQRLLLLLENALWGNRGKKSAIRLELHPVRSLQPRRFPEQDLVKQLPPPDHPKTKPGLSYLIYGIGEHQERAYYLATGTQWELTFHCQPASLVSGGERTKINISAEQVLAQAQAALWLLCQFGGSGQRMRRGLGCLQLSQAMPMDLNDWLQAAENLREQCGFSAQFDEKQCDSPALQIRLETELLTPWKNEWFALHQLGYAYQSFLQKYKHQALKQGLGLPRQIGEPVQGEFQASSLVKERHASPFFLHFARQPETDRLLLRILAFPSAQLPDRESSRQLLSEMLQHIHSQMLNQIEAHPLEPELHLQVEAHKARSAHRKGLASERPLSTRRHKTETEASGESKERPVRKPRSERQGERSQHKKTERSEAGSFSRRAPRREERSEEKSGRVPRESTFSRKPRPLELRPIQAGDRIEAILLEERTKKGGWRALYSKGGLSGPIVNSGLVPGEKSPGDTLTLIVHSVNRFEMAFRIPTAADEVTDKGKKKKSRAKT